MISKRMRGLARIVLEFAAIMLVTLVIGTIGYFLTVRFHNGDVPALLKLRHPLASTFQIIIPMVATIIVTRFIVQRRHLTHVVWREPEFVSPKDGGKAPTYAPPLDTHDDLFLGTALSSEPEPFYTLNVQPRISRLWWLLGALISLGALLTISYGITHIHVTPIGFTVGVIATFTWAYAQEFLLRGLVIAEMRRLARRDRWAIAMSMLLSIPWMIPLAMTASTPTRTLVLILIGPIMSPLLFALRRMFTTLWAPIGAQFLFSATFFVLI
ncbi:MAG: hypothetical protein Q4P71_03315 [Actinomycetaceae bacterium]|nr:hypothetical protein [Actinomycetaceae bacterium]